MVLVSKKRLQCKNFLPFFYRRALLQILDMPRRKASQQPYKRLTITLPPELLEDLRILAARDNRPISNWIATRIIEKVNEDSRVPKPGTTPTPYVQPPSSKNSKVAED